MKTVNILGMTTLVSFQNSCLMFGKKDDVLVAIKDTHNEMGVCKCAATHLCNFMLQHAA